VFKILIIHANFVECFDCHSLETSFANAFIDLSKGALANDFIAQLKIITYFSGISSLCLYYE
jgi:hypothetical protein